MFPDDRRYPKDHEWVRIEGAVAKIGITDFAQGELGDIVYVEAPAVGATVAAGDVLGTIESVKAVSEVYAPVAGTVTAANPALADRPETINTEPHGAGWICEIKVARPAELDALMDAAAYTALVGK